jgi:hypothetical protein
MCGAWPPRPKDSPRKSASISITVAKTVITRIVWKEVDRNTLRFHAKVVTADNIGLDLHGHYQKIGRHGVTRWGFSLTYRGNCVRQYDMALKHRNPGGGKVKGPHQTQVFFFAGAAFCLQTQPANIRPRSKSKLAGFLSRSEYRDTRKLSIHHVPVVECFCANSTNLSLSPSKA